MKLPKLFLKGGAIVVGLLAIFWLALGLWPNPLTDAKNWDWTVRVTDRQGRLLKDFLPPKVARRETKPLNEFSPHLLNAIITAEDKRFYYHLGVDPLAVLRAAWLNTKHGAIISGASTLTMQLARLNQGLSPGPRTFARKLKEVWRALLIERHNSKDVILTEYLNTINCGNLTQGFPAAAQLYLGKSVADLSPAEAAFLAGLPPSPGLLNPYKDPRPALNRRAIVLKKMATRGQLTQVALKRALSEPLALNTPPKKFNAPHFVSYIRSNFGQNPPPILTTTLDLTLQEKVEGIVRTTVDKYQYMGLRQVAVVVMSLPEREVLAWVGSSDFWAAQGGQNDGVLALRQPGSALKPFLYATAFDQGDITAATLLNDGPTDYLTSKGSFSPTNYSGTFHGSVSARLALASSLNLPAVKLSAQVGLNEFLTRLRGLGLESLNKSSEFYGLSLALGAGEVNLLSLTTAYAALADGGQWKPAQVTHSPSKIKLSTQTSTQTDARNIFTPGSSFLVSHILSDPQARRTGFGAHSVLETPYPATVKTGTSKNFRDNWCLGYTQKFVVGVWAGNFEANPMSEVSGITGAGTVWRQVVDLLAQANPPVRREITPDIVALITCPTSGLTAGPYCPNPGFEYFLVNGPKPLRCQEHASTKGSPSVASIMGLKRTFKLMQPLTGEVYAMDPGINSTVQNIHATAQSVPGVDELVWRLNGQEIKREKAQEYSQHSCLVPISQGKFRLELWGLKEGEVFHSTGANYIVH